MSTARSKLQEAFLTSEERSKIQRMFEKWNQNLQSRTMAESFYTNSLFRSREWQEFNVKKTDHDKSEYLFETCLMRATYKQIELIRELLVKSKVNAHIHLARMLPCRSHDKFWERYDSGQDPYIGFSTPQEETAESKPDTKITSPSEPMDTNTSDVRKEHSSSYTHQPSNQQATANLKSPPQNQSQGHTATAAAQADPSTQQPGGMQHNHPINQRQMSSSLNRYDSKRRGLVLIVANFTKDDTGKYYEKDIARISNFFGNTLNYEIVVEKDKKINDMVQILQQTQQKLKRIPILYDRFFCFVLTHGDEEGLKTCHVDGRNEELQRNGRPEHIKPDDIVSMFTHDQIPSLRNFPKVFFFQACAGENVAKAAGEMVRQDDEVIARAAAKAEKITVGADVLVCQASHRGHYSWVNPTGSWLIQTTLDVFEGHYQQEHVLDMLTEVNLRISKFTMKGSIQGRIQEDVRQLPAVSHNLTSKFYLQNN